MSRFFGGIYKTTDSLSIKLNDYLFSRDNPAEITDTIDAYMVSPHAKQSLLWRYLDIFRHFLVWLTYDGTLAIYHFWQSTAANFESQIAVITTFKNLGKPLFQDYTREGRLIGFILRIGRVIAGLAVQIIVALFFILALIAWLALPYYLLYQITRNLINLNG